jgi:hypothetical protein
MTLRDILLTEEKIMSNWFRDDSNGFIVYKTMSEDIELARKIHAQDFKKSNNLNGKTVYNREESRIAGILGEIVFGKYVGRLGVRGERGDVIYDYIVNGKKVDVKCKFRTVPPKPTFEASFFAYQSSSHFADVDYYAFLSTIVGYEYVWFCGVVSKQEWLKNPLGRLWKAGEIDTSNGMKFQKDTWSVFYKDLGKFGTDPSACFI